MVIILVSTQEEKEKIERLIETYGKELYSFAFRLTLSQHDADDLFQQTWLKVVDHFSALQDNNFRAWVYKVCENQFKDNYRKAKTKKRVIKDDYASNEQKAFVISNAPGLDNPQDEIENRAVKVMILEKLNNLPETKRAPILMYYYQAMNYEEIAEALRIPVGTVRSRIFDAKKILKQQMEGEIYV